MLIIVLILAFNLHSFVELYADSLLSMDLFTLYLLQNKI